MTESPPATTPSAISAGKRNAFLDVVRTIATIRVVAWHAFGAPVLSYLVAAMPAMFFVFGALLGKSADRRPLRSVVTDRLRRTMLPLWAFALITWAFAVVVLQRSAGESPWLSFASWLFPIVDPMAVPWESEWLSSPLWFLRALIWILALSPLWLAASKAKPRLTLAVFVSGIFITDIATRIPELVPQSAPGIWWSLGDIALYGSFAVAGSILNRKGYVAGAVDRRITLAIVGVGALASLVWVLTQSVHLNVVNNSHPLHFFVGTAWLALAFTFKDHLVAASFKPAISQVVRVVNQRSMTIYLWHSLAIIASVSFLGSIGFSQFVTEPIIRTVLVIFGVAVAVLAFGWIEDIAAGRRRMAWPTAISWPQQFAPAHIGVAAVTMLAVLGPSAVNPTSNMASEKPPIPSQQPPTPQFGENITPVAFDTTPLNDEEMSLELRNAMFQWRSQLGISGVSMSVIDRFGNEHSATSGTRPGTRSPVSVSDEFDVASITKMYTASMVFELVDKGQLDLDAPIPHLYAYPDLPHVDQLTPRMLLTHKSGLVNYRDTAIYKKDPAAIATPEAAIQASAGEPLLHEPGTVADYSSTNFLILGAIIEQVTGLTFDELMQDRFIGPLGLQHTSLTLPEAGEPRHSTAGVVTNVSELAHSSRAILRDHINISEDAYAQMTSLDYDSSFGMGTIGFCPCEIDNLGNKSFFSVGHYGSDAVVSYVPELDVTVALRLTEPMHGEARFGPTVDLMEIGARIANRAAPVT
jgi:CubicO group peptidase (beta-lactamase class C family)/peptidoglycan/LPS O-acetylase OafA/YrhL